MSNKKYKGRSGPTAQSAIEYLITHSWALLVIAVVLAVLFELGAFSYSSYTPKAAPGSCYVSRSTGAYATQLSLTGECGQLPQFVSVFDANDYFNASGGFNNNQVGYTVSMWVYTNQSTFGSPITVAQGTTSSPCLIFSITGNPITIYAYNSAIGSYQTAATGASLSFNVWQMLTVTYAKTTSSNVITVYIDGSQAGSSASAYEVSAIAGTTLSTGVGGSECATSSYTSNFIGSISNVQVYNTSLSATAVHDMYITGIGTPPNNLQRLAGWWPLNDDGNDYSGLNNNAKLLGSVTFSSSWVNTYTV